MSDARQIGPGMQVTLHFSLQLEDGELVDSTFGKSPATFTWGDGSLLPGFEAAMQGLCAGAEASLRVAADEAFGAPNPNNVHSFQRAQLPADADLRPGLMLAFTDPGGNELPGVIAAVQGETVRVDFNHPLAGRDILFKVQIIDVRPVTSN